jgi:proteasome lid subunit RPN8/RPN11
MPVAAREAMEAHARFCAPEECCGLLAGESGRVRFVYPLTNIEHSPTSFTIDPTEHFRAWKHALANGWDLIGAFHSHPSGPPRPSRTDLALAGEPDWVYLIVVEGSITGWSIRDRAVEPIELLISG